MALRRQICKGALGISLNLFFCLIAIVSHSSAALRLDSVSPSIGKVNQEGLVVELKGSGFDTNTSVSMAYDGSNSWLTVGSIHTKVSANAVVLDGDFAYVADSVKGLLVIDVSNLATLRVIGSTKPSGYGSPDAVAIDSCYAYVTTAENVEIFDVSVGYRTYPKGVGQLDTRGNPNGIAVAKGYAYVANHFAASNGNFQVFDVNALKNSSVARVDLPAPGQDVTVRGNYAYGGLLVMDISSPVDTRQVGSLTGIQADGVAVEGKYAYVVSGDYSGSRLHVIDISNPRRPLPAGSVSVSGRARNVFLSGDYAYVSCEYAQTERKSGGLQVVNISRPQDPRVIGSVKTASDVKNVFVDSNMAYLASGNVGVRIVDVPREISSISVNGTGSISATLPASTLAGNYAIRVFKNSESAEISGAINILGSQEYQALRQRKAIIVVGYDQTNYQVDNIWNSTKASADTAYDFLAGRGYNDHIRYLSPEHDNPDNNHRVNGLATRDNLFTAIADWAHGTSELLLYMVGHGRDNAFLLGPDPTERLLAGGGSGTLVDFLNQLQTNTDRVIMIYDACRSGSFIPQLSPLPDGKERIVITSTEEDEDALFINTALRHKSFSNTFWWTLMTNGYYLVTAFNRALGEMECNQTAQLDADGDGNPNEAEDNISGIVIGSEGGAGAIPRPVISEVSPGQALNGQVTAGFWATGVEGVGSKQIVHVYAEIHGPEGENSRQANTAVPTVELVNADQDGTYQGNYDSFSMIGTYKILISAEDEAGGRSLPR